MTNGISTWRELTNEIEMRFDQQDNLKICRTCFTSRDKERVYHENVTECKPILWREVHNL